MSHAAVLPSPQSSQLTQTFVLGTCHFSLFICFSLPSHLLELALGRLRFGDWRCTGPSSSSLFKVDGICFACQAGPLNSFVKVQLRDHSPVPGSLSAWLLACVRLRAEGVHVCLAAKGRSRRARDVSCWRQAPVCCWHLGRVFGHLPH